MLPALLLLALALPGAWAQGSKVCVADGGHLEAASTSGYQVRLGYSCSTVLGGNPPFCNTLDWRKMQYGKISVPDNEDECHMYHCSGRSECDMCSDKTEGAVLTEPCSCQTIKAASRAAFPHSCLPNPLAARGEPCVHGFQCATGFCCPQLKVCLTDSLDGGAVPLSPDWVKAIVGGAQPTCAQGLDHSECKSYENGEPTAEFDQTACGCSAEYMTHFNAETWVQCGTACTCGGGAPCPAVPTSNCAVDDAVRAYWAFTGGGMWLEGKIQSLDAAGGTITVIWDEDSTTSVVPWAKVFAGKAQCAMPGDPASAPTPGQGAPAPAPKPADDKGDANVKDGLASTAPCTGTSTDRMLHAAVAVAVSMRGLF